MIKSACLRPAFSFYLLLTGAAALLSISCILPDDVQLVTWANRNLQSWYAPDAGAKLKNWTLSVTPDCFLRLRKRYSSGKQEYYSFHLHRFKDLDYLGTTTAGTLRLRTDVNDIIVQTYDDPKGNIDSMASALDLPVHDVTPEQLDSLRLALLKLKASR